VTLHTPPRADQEKVGFFVALIEEFWIGFEDAELA
jgi:hypothetical protein